MDCRWASSLPSRVSTYVGSTDLVEDAELLVFLLDDVEQLLLCLSAIEVLSGSLGADEVEDGFLLVWVRKVYCAFECYLEYTY